MRVLGDCRESVNKCRKIIKKSESVLMNAVVHKTSFYLRRKIKKSQIYLFEDRSGPLIKNIVCKSISLIMIPMRVSNKTCSRFNGHDFLPLNTYFIIRRRPISRFKAVKNFVDILHPRKILSFLQI